MIPGKVLFYGGYSVLLKGHISLSIAVVDKEGKGVSYRWEHGEEKVVSPQFNIDGLPEGALVTIAYQTAKEYLSSWGWQETTVYLENSPIFGKPGEKSGLGSSAAATVATISALFEAQGYHSYAHVETIHKLSQIAYAKYAKKLGSGFDIATSSFRRTIIYRRYDPESVSLENWKESIHRPWPWLEATPVSLPAQIQVFNIKGGSTSTISAVKAWKEWKSKEPEAFKELMARQNEAETKAIEALLSGNWEEARKYTHEARKVHQEMQERISRYVQDFEPIEPPEITRFIEEAEKRYNVIGRAPGAGGRDSVAFLGDRRYPLAEVAKELGLDVEEIEVRMV
ncbi:MAG: hypothetical protein GXN92_00335 [Candidatus Micrarchaeota archaeon]|nr:hypothetical protein [Candidatus Micrarchaeota archaeon]